MVDQPDTLVAKACEKLKAPSPCVVEMVQLVFDNASKLGCEPALDSHGYMHGLRLLRGRDWCFSAIPTNSGWLTWYFRKPELRRRRMDFAAVHEDFPAARERSDGEITVRLHDVDDVRRMLNFIAARG